MLGISVIEAENTLTLAEIHNYVDAFSDKEKNMTLEEKNDFYNVPKRYRKKTNQMEN